jgi:two-component system, OmpR family, sensor kinase
VSDAPASRAGSEASSRLLQAHSPRERRFVQDASHMLRSPLTVCRWQLELLGDGAATEGEGLGRVLAELGRMEHLLDDLCVLAEVGEPGFLRPEPVDLELFAHEVAAEAGTLAERDWRLECAEGTVVADPYRLRVAVLKLVRNAILHTDRDSTVAIGAGREEGEVRVWVSDTGVASSAERRVEIWERSAEDACARRDLHVGGMDLAVVRAIVAAHEGRVEIERAPGEVTTFTIVLPAENAEIGTES